MLHGEQRTEHMLIELIGRAEPPEHIILEASGIAEPDGIIDVALSSEAQRSTGSSAWSTPTPALRPRRLLRLHGSSPDRPRLLISLSQ